MTRRGTDWLTPKLLALAALLATASFSPYPIQAQQRLGQYTVPGTTADRPGDEKERLETQMENSLWNLGGLRLNPWIGITNASVVSNAFNTGSVLEETDFTMTLGAGVEGIVPFGQKTFLTLDFIPQYVFWLEQDERNNFNQWYGARLFGFYNRLYLETGVKRRDQLQVLSSEADVDNNTRRDTADILGEVRLGQVIHLFAGAALGRIESLEEDAEGIPNFSSQDRDETALRLGFRYKPEPNSFVGIGVESSEADFASDARDRSNSGDSPFVQFQYDGPTFFITGEVVFRDLEPEGETSQFLPFDGETGGLQITYDQGWRMTYTGYGHRNLSYALDENYSYFENDRFGVRIGAILSDRWNLSGFFEAGTDDYTELPDTLLPREDDVTGWGINFDFQISERFGLGFGYSLTEWDSNLPQFNRENGRIRINISSTGLVLGRR